MVNLGGAGLCPVGARVVPDKGFCEGGAHGGTIGSPVLDSQPPEEAALRLRS